MGRASESAQNCAELRAELRVAYTVSLTERSSSFETRSTLLMTTRSANATCCTASFTVPSGRTSSSWPWMNLQSTSVATQSMR